MIAIDPLIIDFVSNNWVTLSLALGVLKIIAKLTPTIIDDSILALLAAVFSLVKGKSLKIPEPPGKGVELDENCG